MEPETSSSLLASRCRHCGAGLRAGAPWCTLCLTPAGPAPGAARAAEALAVGSPTAAPVGADPRALDPLTAPLELLLGTRAPAPAPAPAQPSWPCASCATPNPLESSTCAGCGAGFLEALARDEPPLLVLPGLGDVSAWSKLQWLGLGAVLLVAALSLVLVAGALLG